MVGIVTTVTGAFYALWKIILMPVLRAIALRLLKHEVGAIEQNGHAVARMWNEQLAQRQTLERIETNMGELRDMVIELFGQAGGRRKFDAP